MFPHQVIARHVEIKTSLTHDVIERIRAEIGVQHLLIKRRSWVLSETDETGIGIKFIDRDQLGHREVIVSLTNPFLVRHTQWN